MVGVESRRIFKVVHFLVLKAIDIKTELNAILGGDFFEGGFV